MPCDAWANVKCYCNGIRRQGVKWAVAARHSDVSLLHMHRSRIVRMHDEHA